jgi:hypothetical protein
VFSLDVQLVLHWGEGVATESETAAHVHSAAPHHVAPFITAPGGTDWLLIAVGILLILMVVGIGVFYLKLHALPEHMAHRGQKVQYEIVAVLALIALFTHNHAFWIVGLLLALVPIPDFSTPLSSIANSLDRMAERPGAGARPTSEGPVSEQLTVATPPPVAPRAPAGNRADGKDA